MNVLFLNNDKIKFTKINEIINIMNYNILNIDGSYVSKINKDVLIFDKFGNIGVILNSYSLCSEILVLSIKNNTANI